MMNNLAMEDNFGCLWNCEENIEELKEKVLVMSYELESTRKQANEEMKKNEDRLLELLNHLQTAYKERDEARHQLHTLQNHYAKTTTTHQHFLSSSSNNNNNSSSNPTTTATFTPLSPQSPLPIVMIPTTTTTNHNNTPKSTAAATGVCNNSSTSASDSPSIDSFFDTPVSSPDFSTFNPVVESATDHLNTTNNNTLSFNQQQPLIPEFSSSLPPFSPTPLIISPDAPTTNKSADQASAIISSLAKGKPLPQKGKLLQAVMEAGPLLQTLMVAGPLPRWRNPPPSQPLQIPPFQASSTFGTSNIDEITTATTSSRSILLSGRGFNSPRLTTSSGPPTAKRSYDSLIRSGNFLSCAGSSTQMYNNSMLNFGGVNGGGSMAGLSTGGVGTGGCAGGRMMMTSMMSGSSRPDNFLINTQNLSSIPKRQRIL